MLRMYDAPETATSNSNHCIKLTFQYGEHKAEVITGMGGNIYGADLLASYDKDAMFDLTAPVDNEINQKHCVFDEDEDTPYRTVTAIRLYHPNRPEEALDIETAADYLVGIEIVGFEASGDGEEE